MDKLYKLIFLRKSDYYPFYLKWPVFKCACALTAKIDSVMKKIHGPGENHDIPVTLTGTKNIVDKKI